MRDARSPVAKDDTEWTTGWRDRLKKTHAKVEAAGITSEQLRAYLRAVDPNPEGHRAALRLRAAETADQGESISRMIDQYKRDHRKLHRIFGHARGQATDVPAVCPSLEACSKMTGLFAEHARVIRLLAKSLAGFVAEQWFSALHPPAGSEVISDVAGLAVALSEEVGLSHIEIAALRLEYEETVGYRRFTEDELSKLHEAVKTAYKTAQGRKRPRRTPSSKKATRATSPRRNRRS
jgi:hypothetical protein